MDNKFSFNIYSRRWGHDDCYSIKITDNGWHFWGTTSFLTGECDKKGSPFLFDALQHESINYPKELDEYLEHLWHQAKDRKLSQEEIQNALNILVEWINLCEKSSPMGLWESLK